MFRKDVKSIKELILRNLRVQGLETPLLQKRLMDAWPVVAGNEFGQIFITDTNRDHLDPALRADLSMQRSEYVKRLNDYVGSQVITDIRFN